MFWEKMKYSEVEQPDFDGSNGAARGHGRHQTHNHNAHKCNLFELKLWMTIRLDEDKIKRKTEQLDKLATTCTFHSIDEKLNSKQALT